LGLKAVVKPQTSESIMKTLFNITNQHGAFLMSVTAKDAKNAIRQARKTWNGKIKAVEVSGAQ
jgi:hypothetical protein